MSSLLKSRLNFLGYRCTLVRLVTRLVRARNPKPRGHPILTRQKKVGSWTVSYPVTRAQVNAYQGGGRDLGGSLLHLSLDHGRKMCWKICIYYHNLSIATEEHIVLSLQKI